MTRRRLLRDVISDLVETIDALAHWQTQPGGVSPSIIALMEEELADYEDEYIRMLTAQTGPVFG